MADEVRDERDADDAHDAPEARDAHDEHDDRGAGAGDADGVAEEADVLRRELERARRALQEANEELEQARDRALRARADLENLRRRSQAEVDRAREAGLDAALLPVLTVYDDLGRALQAAETGDPASIVPGVRAVRETFERQLAALGVERVGTVGERFDPDRHEALTVVPRSDDADAGTIADVFEVGFVRGDRLVRPARVIVFEPD